MDKNLILLPAIALFIACSSGRRDKQAENIHFVTTPVEQEQKEQIIMPSYTDTVQLDLVNGKGSIQIRKKENQTVYVEFMSEGYKNILAHISSPDSLANIRISQIFLPNGTMDGPFSRDLQYQLPKDGKYKISIHENMMAGDPWAGVFKVDISLLK